MVQCHNVTKKLQLKEHVLNYKLRHKGGVQCKQHMERNLYL